MNNKRYPVAMEIAGLTAMWANPDCGDSPCSYPAPTLSACRSLFESVVWGPDILVIPTKVELCSPPRFHSYVTNYGGPLREPKSIKNGNSYQLHATVLVDVCYRLYADVTQNPQKENLPASAKNWDSKTTSPGHAYQAIFNRRLERGQSYATLFLGWNEFTPSYFGPFRAETKVCEDLPDIYIPSMLRELFPDGYRSNFRAVYDTDLCIHKGVLEYPQRGDEP